MACLLSDKRAFTSAEAPSGAVDLQCTRKKALIWLPVLNSPRLTRYCPPLLSATEGGREKQVNLFKLTHNEHVCESLLLYQHHKEPYARVHTGTESGSCQSPTLWEENEYLLNGKQFHFGSHDLTH